MNSNDKVCYLHIGTHKTGSTTIQRFLINSRDELMSRGVLYPSVGVKGTNKARKNIAFALTSFASHGGNSPILRQLADQLRKVDRDIIISAETLSEKIVRPKVLAPLKAYFKGLGFRLHVIVYLRDQASYINSRYVQDVKRLRFGGSFAERLENVLSEPENSYDYWNHYQPLICDPDIVFEPRSFAEVRKTGLLEDFVSAIPPLADGTCLKNYKGESSMNPNAGTRSVFVARLVTNSVEGSGSEKFQAQLLPQILRRCYLKRKWYESPFVGLDTDTAKAIESRYAEGNNRLARKFWNCDWATLNPPTTWKRNVFSFIDAPSNEREEVMKVAVMLMSRLGGSDSSEPKKSKTGGKQRSGPQGPVRKAGLLTRLSRLLGLGKH